MSYGQNIPLSLHERLKELEHLQNFELLRSLNTRNSLEGNVLNSNDSQNSTGSKDIPKNQQHSPVSNENIPQAKTEILTIAPLQPLVTSQKTSNTHVIQTLPKFTSLHPNSLSFLSYKAPFSYNTVRIPHPVPVPVHIKVPVTVEKPYPVQVTKTVAVPIEKPVYIRIPQPIQVPVAQPYPVPVPQPVEVRVLHPIYIRVLPNGQQYIIENFSGNN